MPLKLSRQIFMVSAVLCVVLRVWLHIVFIDPETGFYEGGNIIVYIYNILLAGGIISMFLLGMRGKINECKIIVTPILRISALVGSIGALILAIPNPEQLLGPSYLPRHLSLILLRIFTLSFAPLITAFLLIYIGVKSKETFAHVNGYLMLLPVIWIATMLLSRFMEFTASRHISDQMLTITMLSFATLFLLAMSRLAAGLTPQKTTQQLIAFGFPFALLAFSVCSGIASGFESNLGLALTLPESIAFLLIGFFAITLCFSIRETQNSETPNSETTN